MQKSPNVATFGDFITIHNIYAVLSHMHIFFSRGKSASYMSFRFVNLQNFSYRTRKFRVYFFYPVSYVLVYRRFTYTEFFRGFPHRRIWINYKIRYLYRSFFDIWLQEKHSSKQFLAYLYAPYTIYMLICIITVFINKQILPL